MKHPVLTKEMGLSTSDTQCPEKRLDGIVAQQVGAETLLYDEVTHKAYCLNATAAAVWSACDGSQSISAIAAKVTMTLAHPVDKDLVLFTLKELRRDGLLKPGSLSAALPSPSRRVLLRRLGAGAVFLLPAIALLSAPKAAHALSGVVVSG